MFHCGPAQSSGRFDHKRRRTFLHNQPPLNWILLGVALAVSAWYAFGLNGAFTSLLHKISQAVRP